MSDGLLERELKLIRRTTSNPCDSSLFFNRFGFYLIKKSVMEGNIKKEMEAAVNEMKKENLDVLRCGCSCQIQEMTIAGLPGRTRVKCSSPTSCNMRRNNFECPEDCGDYCQNRFISNNQLEVNSFGVKATDEKGLGLKTNKHISKGKAVAEIVGRIIKIIPEIANPHFVIQIPNTPFWIWYENIGNQTRFINHSHNPNLIAKPYIAGDEIRLVLFAKVEIPSGSELTLFFGENYLKDECKCKEDNCPNSSIYRTTNNDWEDDKLDKDYRRIIATERYPPSPYKRRLSPSSPSLDHAFQRHDFNNFVICQPIQRKLDWPFLEHVTVIPEKYRGLSSKVTRRVPVARVPSPPALQQTEIEPSSLQPSLIQASPPNSPAAAPVPSQGLPSQLSPHQNIKSLAGDIVPIQSSSSSSSLELLPLSTSKVTSPPRKNIFKEPILVSTGLFKREQRIRKPSTRYYHNNSTGSGSVVSSFLNNDDRVKYTHLNPSPMPVNTKIDKFLTSTEKGQTITRGNVNKMPTVESLPPIKGQGKTAPRFDVSKGLAYYCPYCDNAKKLRPFTNKRHFEQHLITHDPTRWFFCDWENCPKFYKYEKGLKTHKQKHEGNDMLCGIEINNGVQCQFKNKLQYKLNEHRNKMHRGWTLSQIPLDQQMWLKEHSRNWKDKETKE